MLQEKQKVKRATFLKLKINEERAESIPKKMTNIEDTKEAPIYE